MAWAEQLLGGEVQWAARSWSLQHTPVGTPAGNRSCGFAHSVDSVCNTEPSTRRPKALNTLGRLGTKVLCPGKTIVLGSFTKRTTINSLRLLLFSYSEIFKYTRHTKVKHSHGLALRPLLQGSQNHKEIITRG